MKHMAELQLSVISDSDVKQQLSAQIVQYEENMERLYCEQFRLRCYVSSLQNGELPNPKVRNEFVSFDAVTCNQFVKLGMWEIFISKRCKGHQKI